MRDKKTNATSSKIITITESQKLELYPLPCIEVKQWNGRVNENFDYQKDLLEKSIKRKKGWINNYEKRLNEAERKLKDYISNNHIDNEDKDKNIKALNKQINKCNKKIRKYEKECKEHMEKINAYQKEQDRFNEIINHDNLTKDDTEFINKTAKNYTYSLIRRACKSEAARKNATLSYTYSECIRNNVADMEDFGDICSAIDEILKHCNRTRNGLSDDLNIDNPLGGYGISYNQNLRSSFINMVKKGLFDGRVSLVNYKSDSPVSIAGAHYNFFPSFDLIGFEDFYDLKRVMQKENGVIYLNVGSNGLPSIARFRVVIGSKNHKSDSIYAFLYNVLKNNYPTGGSSIQIENNKIMLNLSYKKSSQEIDTLKDDVVVGVDVGISIPAVCALNNSKGYRWDIGDKKEFLRIRTKLQEQKKRITNKKDLCSSGKEKKKINKASFRLTKHIKHWKRTYNHMLSRRIIKFAIKNNARYINLENIPKFDKKEKERRFLKEWSYYELQKYIEYKAKEYGIIVRYVKAENTSTTCSCCGNTDEEQRNKSIFVCKNHECKQYGKKVNSDFNAARNIALSTDFFSKKELNEESLENED